MKKWLFLLILGMIFVLIPAGVQAAGYTLRPGDSLDINVMGFDELSTKQAAGVLIRPDGTISFPYIGEIAVQGLTVGELSVRLTEQLKTYYKDPVVTINLVKFSTMRVYVLGQVTKPGLYELDRSRNLVDAIGMAGGWTKDAAKTKIMLIHVDSKKPPTKINLLKFLTKGDLSQNPSLQEGDVVYLSENGKINVAQDVLPYMNAIYQFRYYWSNTK